MVWRSLNVRSLRVVVSALVGSVLLHGVGVTLLLLGWIGPVSQFPSGLLVEHSSAAYLPLLGVADEFEQGQVVSDIDLVSESDILLDPQLMMPPGDQDRRVLEETAPRQAPGVDPRPPSTDSGATAGRAIDRDVAFRRDRQTLRAHLSDGAKHYAPSRMRTGVSSTTSPQAVRQEPLTGTGDVPRSGEKAQPSVAHLVAGTSSDQAIQKSDVDVASPGSVAVAGQGPLDAREGSRQFDAVQIGVATDAVDERSASDERRPGPLDLSSPGAVSSRPSDTQEGQGPDQQPGVVPHRARGPATALAGAPRDLPVGATLALSSADQKRIGYEREIRRRAGSMLRYPRRMALMMEQGETIVRFVVGRNGHVDGGVTVIKSAGFEDFDKEAVSAVQRAAPYPRMPTPLVVNMRFAFRNPVIR